MSLNDWHGCPQSVGLQWKINDEGYIVVENRGILFRDENDEQAIQLTGLLYKSVLEKYCTKYEVDVRIVLALIASYASFYKSHNMYSPLTKYVDRGWVSDSVTPNKVRYGLTGIRLIDARSCSEEIKRSTNAINHVFIRNVSNCIQITCLYLRSISSRAVLGKHINDPILLFSIWDVGSLRRGRGDYGIWVSELLGTSDSRIEKFISGWNSSNKILSQIDLSRV